MPTSNKRELYEEKAERRWNRLGKNCCNTSSGSRSRVVSREAVVVRDEYHPATSYEDSAVDKEELGEEAEEMLHYFREHHSQETRWSNFSCISTHGG